MLVTMQSISNNSYTIQISTATTFQSLCKFQIMTKNLWSINWKSNLYHMFSMAFSKNNFILFSSTQIDDIYLSLCLIVRIVVFCFLAYKLMTKIFHSTHFYITKSLGSLFINQHELSWLNEFGGYRKSSVHGTHKPLFSTKFLLKMGLTTLFTCSKIILLQCF